MSGVHSSLSGRDGTGSSAEPTPPAPAGCGSASSAIEPSHTPRSRAAVCGSPGASATCSHATSAFCRRLSVSTKRNCAWFIDTSVAAGAEYSTCCWTRCCSPCSACCQLASARAASACAPSSGRLKPTPLTHFDASSSDSVETAPSSRSSPFSATYTCTCWPNASRISSSRARTESASRLRASSGASIISRPSTHSTTPLIGAPLRSRLIPRSSLRHASNSASSAPARRLQRPPTSNHTASRVMRKFKSSPRP